MEATQFTDADLEKIKVPPHSMEAEQSILGGLMLDNHAWDTVSEVVMDDNFYRQEHRQIFRTMRKLLNDGKPIDVVTLSEELDRTAELESAGGLDYLIELAKNTPSASNIRAYSEIVRDRSLLRQMITAANEIADGAFNPEGRSSDEILNSAEQKIFQIAENRPNQGGPQGVNELLKKTISDVQQFLLFTDSLKGLFPFRGGRIRKTCSPHNFTFFINKNGCWRSFDFVFFCY